jgi:hypothetical protein
MEDISFACSYVSAVIVISYEYTYVLCRSDRLFPIALDPLPITPTLEGFVFVVAPIVDATVDCDKVLEEDATDKDDATIAPQDVEPIGAPEHRLHALIDF